MSTSIACQCWRYPNEHVRDNLAAVLASDAVVLFAQRARTLDPTFQVTAATAASVAELCARVEGLPLGIELLVPRLRVLGLTAWCSACEQPGAGVRGGADRPDRQRTLTTMVEWSYRLLPPREQRLFARLAIFVGGWDLAAVEDLCADEQEPAGAVLDGLAALVASSLVEVRGTVETGRRFRLLEPVREVAWEHAGGVTGTRGVRERHLQYYLDLAAQLSPAARGSDGGAVLQRLDGEYANVRVALRRAIDAQHSDRVLAAVADLRVYWEARVLLSEARTWIAAALALPEGSAPQARTRALMAAGHFHYMVADWEPARRYRREALQLAEATGDRRTQASALHSLGLIAAFNDRDYATGTTLITRAQSLHGELGNTRELAFSAIALGGFQMNAGNAQAALQWYQESARRAVEAGDRLGEALAHFETARAIATMGDTWEARRVYTRLATVFQQLGDRLGEVETHAQLDWLALRDDQRAPECESNPRWSSVSTRSLLGRSRTGITLLAIVGSLKRSISRPVVTTSWGWQRRRSMDLAWSTGWECCGWAGWSLSWGRPVRPLRACAPTSQNKDQPLRTGRTG